VIVVRKIVRSPMAAMPGWLLIIFGVPGDPLGPAGGIGFHGCFVLHATRRSLSHAA
jgi:hypothetical protein